MNIDNNIEQLDILEKINKALDSTSDKYMCRFTLFQFLQLKRMEQNKRDYVGYILLKGKKNTQDKNSYTLDNAYIGTLNSRILEELKTVEIDDYFFELICQFNSKDYLTELLRNIAKKKQIDLPENLSCYEIFCILKNKDESIFRSYEENTKKHKQDSYFHFRFFKLSDAFAPYEDDIWEALQPEFGWRNAYNLTRGL